VPRKKAITGSRRQLTREQLAEFAPKLKEAKRIANKNPVLGYFKIRAIIEELERRYGVKDGREYLAEIEAIGKEDDTG